MVISRSRTRRAAVKAATGGQRKSKMVVTKSKCTPRISIKPIAIPTSDSVARDSNKIVKPLKISDFVKSAPKKKVRKPKQQGKLTSDFLKEKPDKGPFCLPLCSHGGLDVAESMIRCCICMRWVHPTSCCSDSIDDANLIGMYTCIQCRNIYDKLSCVENKLDELQSLNKDLIRMLEAKELECMDLRKLRQEKSSSGDPDVHVRQIQVNDKETSSVKSCSKPTPKPRSSINRVSKKKVSVLGSSIIRNTGPIMSKSLPNMDTCTYSVSGLSIIQASEIAPKIFHGFKSSDTAVLQVGTNDLPFCFSDELESKYDKLINSVRTTAPGSKIILTAVPHRLTPGSTVINQKADHLNRFFSTRCSSEKNLIFTDANPQCIRYNYKYDGTHFNYQGTSFFANYISEYISHSSNFSQVTNPLYL